MKNAKKISIEYDPDSDKTDKYERHLVWVYVDDSLLQKELISKVIDGNMLTDSNIEEILSSSYVGKISMRVEGR